MICAPGQVVTVESILFLATICLKEMFFCRQDCEDQMDEFLSHCYYQQVSILFACPGDCLC